MVFFRRLLIKEWYQKRALRMPVKAFAVLLKVLIQCENIESFFTDQSNETLYVFSVTPSSAVTMMSKSLEISTLGTVTPD